MEKKPKQSFWQIWNLSFGFMGVQVCCSMQYANSSTILEILGADLSHLNFFWLAAPLFGLIAHPLVGIRSDRGWSRFGRRIPYIVCAALLSTLTFLLMPNVSTLFAFAPLLIAGVTLFFMDLSLQVSMQPLRAMVGDMLNHDQKTKGYVVQSIIINIGAVIGSLLPFLLTLGGVSDSAPQGVIPNHIRYSYFIAAAIIVITVMITALKTKEYTPEQMAHFNGDTSNTKPKGRSLLQLLRSAPRVMYQLSLVQFFSWGGFVIMWAYLKPAITGVVTSHHSGELLSMGETQSWVGVLSAVYPIAAFALSFLIANLVTKCGRKLIYRSSLLLGALGFGGLYLLHDQYLMLLPMIGIGAAWAGILSMPYSILARAVDAENMGVYMGLFNITVISPQIFLGLCGGLIIEHLCNLNPHNMLLMAAISMLIAALAVSVVKESK